jgi:hypothetical protein
MQHELRAVREVGMAAPTDQGVVTSLSDLTGVSLTALTSYTADDLDGMPGRLMFRLATRGASASIPGYNGASGLSGDAKTDVIEQRV